MNFLYDRLFTESQRRRIEEAERRALAKQQKVYADMKAAARRNAEARERTGQSEIEEMTAAANESAEYKRLARKFEALEEETTAARFALYDEIMAEYLATVGTDPAAILADFSEKLAVYVLDLDACQDAERDAAGLLKVDYINARINTDILPYYVEALAETGEENAFTQLRNCVFEHLHNCVIVSKLPEPAKLPAPADPETVLKRPSRLETLLVMRDNIINEVVIPKNPALDLIGFTQEENGQLKMAWAANEDKKRDLYTIVSLRLEPDEIREYNITPFEIAILDVIATRYRQHLKSPAGRTGGAFYISPAQILDDVTGKKYDDPKPEALNEIRRVIEGMRKKWIDIDFTQEVKAGRVSINGQRGENGKLDGFMLQAKHVQMKMANGKQIDVYKISDYPILYDYCGPIKNNVDEISYKWFEIEDAFRKSDARAGRLAGDPGIIALKFYLVKEIRAMCDLRRKQRFMKYATIWQQSGTDPRDATDPDTFNDRKTYQAAIRRKDKRNRERVAAILDAWTARGFIKGYAAGLDEAGKPAKGVTIYLAPDGDPTRATLTKRE